ncbi:MAG: universal stress protein [Nitrospirae bacterium]|jgi:nucleotide-binding universal stress UspA family protein|nr:universal stress protein [Nitrospirota bacterium]
MISKVLVPTDGSKQAMKSVEYSVNLAKNLSATLTLLSVIDKSAFILKTVPSVPETPSLMEPMEDYLRRAAEAYLGKAEELCRKQQVKYERVIRTGHPVEEIIKEAKKSKVDLIVIGSHGKSALKAAVIGSVTFGVINKDSKIPVLVVR